MLNETIQYTNMCAQKDLTLLEGLNGVNRLATKGEKILLTTDKTRKKLPTSDKITEIYRQPTKVENLNRQPTK